MSAIEKLPGLDGIEFHAVIAQGEHHAYTGETLRGPKFFPAFAEEHYFVQKSLAGLRHSGLNPQIRAYRFCTNGAYSAGHANVPTVGFGPAEGDAHVVDKRVALSELISVANGYREIIESVLG